MEPPADFCEDLNGIWKSSYRWRNDNTFNRGITTENINSQMKKVLISPTQFVLALAGALILVSLISSDDNRIVHLESREAQLSVEGLIFQTELSHKGSCTSKSAGDPLKGIEVQVQETLGNDTGYDLTEIVFHIQMKMGTEYLTEEVRIQKNHRNSTFEEYHFTVPGFAAQQNSPLPFFIQDCSVWVALAVGTIASSHIGSGVGDTLWDRINRWMTGSLF